MNALNNVRLCKHQKVIIAFDVAWPVFKTLTAIISFLKLMPLDHGAHGAIDDQDPFFQTLLNCFHAALLLFFKAVYVDEQYRTLKCAIRQRPINATLPIVVTISDSIIL